jgi:predicted amidohydrolase
MPAASGDHTLSRRRSGALAWGICWENQWAWHSHEMFTDSADLILMPFSAPAGTASAVMSQQQSDSSREAVRNAARSYGRLLGVPVVMANKWGPWESPLPMMLGQRARGAFPGLSAIVDSDGRVLKQMGNEPGVIVAEVVLDPSRKSTTAPPHYGRAGVKQTFPLGSMIAATRICGALYTLNPGRAHRARAIASGPEPHTGR